MTYTDTSPFPLPLKKVPRPQEVKKVFLPGLPREEKSIILKVQVKSLSRVQLLATPWTAAYQAPPSM